MRRFLIFCSVLCFTLYGCSKNVHQGVDGDTSLLYLNVNVDGEDGAPATEVIGTVPNVDLAKTGFKVAGYHTNRSFETTSENLVPNIFNHDKIKLAAVPHVNINSNKYTLPISQYNLSDTTYLSFFTWAQSKVQDNVSGIINSTSKATDIGQPWLALNIDNAPIKQCDIVTSKHVNHLNDRVLTAVDLDFKHILSKLTFRAKSSSGSKIKISKANIKYGSNKVYKEGTYTFKGSRDKDLLTGLKTYHSGEYAITSSLPEIPYNTIEPIMLGDITFIPQTVTDGFISLEISYAVYASNGQIGTTITRSIPIKGLKMLSGNNYTYTIDLTTESIKISQCLVGNWIEIPIDIDESTIVLLDGRDALININGKEYWPDRSGYNNNAELNANKALATHIPGENCYQINTSTTKEGAFKLPAFSEAYNLLVVDIIIDTKADYENSAFLFSSFETGSDMGQRGMFTHLGYSGTIYFDAGGAGAGSLNCDRLEWKPWSVDNPNGYTFNIKEPALFSLSYSKNADGSAQQIIRRNGSTEVGYSITKNHTAAESKGKVNLLIRNYIGWNITAKIKYVRVRGNPKAISDAQMTNEYNLLKERFNI